MEFRNQYLNYNEYVELGGTLDETPFNILELEAQKAVDKYTFGRLQDLEAQVNEVKICIFKLIQVGNTYNGNTERDKSVSSETTDGYSVSYSQTNVDALKAQNEEIKGIIKTYLAECYLEDGTPYLYCGVGR